MKSISQSLRSTLVGWWIRLTSKPVNLLDLSPPHHSSQRTYWALLLLLVALHGGMLVYLLGFARVARGPIAQDDTQEFRVELAHEFAPLRVPKAEPPEDGPDLAIQSPAEPEIYEARPPQLVIERRETSVFISQAHAGLLPEDQGGASTTEGKVDVLLAMFEADPVRSPQHNVEEEERLSFAREIEQRPPHDLVEPETVAVTEPETQRKDQARLWTPPTELAVVPRDEQTPPDLPVRAHLKFTPGVSAGWTPTLPHLRDAPLVLADTQEGAWPEDSGAVAAADKSVKTPRQILAEAEMEGLPTAQGSFDTWEEPVNIAPVPSRRMALVGDVAHHEVTSSPRLAGIDPSAQRKRLLKNYRAEVRTHLARYKPNGGFGSDLVVVGFTLERSGKLVSARIIRSAGIYYLEQGTLNAVHHASPFPKPPGQLKGSRFHFAIPFRFE